MTQDSASSQDHVTFKLEDPNVKTIEILGHIYKIRKWTWREKDMIAAQTYKRQPGQIKGQSDIHEFNELTLKHCVVEWPEGISADNLPADEGDQLLLAVQEYAGGFRKSAESSDSNSTRQSLSMGPGDPKKAE